MAYGVDEPGIYRKGSEVWTVTQEDIDRTRGAEPPMPKKYTAQNPTGNPNYEREYEVWNSYNKVRILSERGASRVSDYSQEASARIGEAARREEAAKSRDTSQVYKPIPTGSSTFTEAQQASRMRADVILARKGNARAESRGIGIAADRYEYGTIPGSETKLSPSEIFQGLKEGKEMTLYGKQPTNEERYNLEYDRLQTKYGSLPWKQTEYKQLMEGNLQARVEKAQSQKEKEYEMFPDYTGPRPSEPFKAQGVVPEGGGIVSTPFGPSTAKLQKEYTEWVVGAAKTPFGGGMGGELTEKGAQQKGLDALGKRLQQKTDRQSFLPQPTNFKIKTNPAVEGIVAGVNYSTDIYQKGYDEQVKQYDKESKKQLSDIIRAADQPNSTVSKDTSGKITITTKTVTESDIVPKQTTKNEVIKSQNIVEKTTTGFLKSMGYNTETSKKASEKLFSDILNTNSYFSPIDYFIVGGAALATSKGVGGLRALSTLKEIGPHTVGLLAFYAGEKIGKYGANTYFNTIDKVIDYSSVGPEYKEEAKKLSRAGIFYPGIKAVEFAAEKTLEAKGFTPEVSKKAAKTVFESPMKPGGNLEKINVEGSGLITGIYTGGLGYGAAKYIESGAEKKLISMYEAKKYNDLINKPKVEPPLYAYENLGMSARRTSSVTFSEGAMKNTLVPETMLKPATVKVKGPELIKPTEAKKGSFFNLGRKGQANINVNIPVNKYAEKVIEVGQAAPSILKQQNIAPGAYIMGDIFANINRPGVALKYEPKFKEKEAAKTKSVYENKFEYTLKNMDLYSSPNIYKIKYGGELKQKTSSVGVTRYNSIDFNLNKPQNIDSIVNKDAYEEIYKNPYENIQVSKTRKPIEETPQKPLTPFGLPLFRFNFGGGGGFSWGRRTKSWSYDNPFKTGKKSLQLLKGTLR